ncbi:LysM peptidoglycan-binding domain-containing protein [Aerococcus urinaeequi]|uniref:C40 family peptidase n=1 Tax=Aerococcus urinaeequi TaxID=51665 RepID=UPI003D6BEAFC
MKFSVKRMVGTSLATSAALAAFATTNVSADEVYTIESGDTLSAISRKFDLSIADLIEVNTIDNQDLIIAGHSLNIPTVDAPVAASTKRVADASNVYTVVAGDTLNKIAADFDTTAQNLRDLNGISGDLILVGQQLKVKGEVAQETTVEQIAPVAEETVETEVEETVNNYVADVNGNYTVVAGDSINKIAGQFGVSASELRVQNNLSSDLILIGQSLAIPGLAAAPAVEEAPVVEETETVVEVASVESTVATEEAEVAPVANSVEETETADAEIEAQVAAEEALAAEEEAQAAADAQVAAEVEAQEQADAEAAAQAEAEAQAAADAQAAAEAEAAAQAQAAVEAAAQAEAEAQAEAAAQAAAEAAAQAEAEAQAAAQTQSGNVTALLNNAYAQVGVPYVWGGKSPSGFDCSGFVNYVYKQTYGVNVGSYTGEQQYAGPKIAVSSAQPGDLIFWGSYGSPYHVAISLGNGQYIHSQRPGETVHSESINPYWAPSFAVSMAAYN